MRIINAIILEESDLGHVNKIMLSEDIVMFRGEIIKNRYGRVTGDFDKMKKKPLVLPSGEIVKSCYGRVTGKFDKMKKKPLVLPLHK